MKVEQVDQMDLKGVGGRQRDKSQVYSGESEALDQIAKEVRIRYRFVRFSSRKCLMF